MTANRLEKHKPAETLQDAYGNCDPAVPIEDPNDPFHVDFSASRGGLKVWEEILTQVKFASDAGKPARVGFFGQRGCGKTSDLRAFMKEAEKEGYFVVYVDCVEQVNPFEFEYSDLLFVIASEATNRLDTAGVSFDRSRLQQVENWFREVTKVSIETTEKAVELATEASAGVGFFKFFKFYAAIKARLRAGHVDKVEFRKRLQAHPRALVENVNEVLKEAAGAVKNKCPRGVIVILDSLDRYSSTMVRAQFAENFKVFDDLTAALVVTSHLSLMNERDEKTASSLFERPVFCPCLAVRPRDGKQGSVTDGMKAFEEVLATRINFSKVFASDEVWREVIRLSGGNAQQLLNLIRRTCIEAKEGTISP
ncbi:MAG: AAA family ATPase, partial [Planctomycetes bacterium]|nr:AAA family ATPase [Planctomycetota bacterium]